MSRFFGLYKSLESRFTRDNKEWYDIWILLSVRIVIIILHEHTDTTEPVSGLLIICSGEISACSNFTFLGSWNLDSYHISQSSIRQVVGWVLDTADGSSTLNCCLDFFTKILKCVLSSARDSRFNIEKFNKYLFIYNCR